MTVSTYEKDRNLVSKAILSDADAMGQIVERHQDTIYRLAYRLVGDIDVAQDMTQKTFLQAFENLHQIQNGRALRPWLCQIVTNLIKDRWKTQKEEIPFEKVEQYFFSHKSSPIQKLEAHETQAHIQAALMKLPHSHREAFLLKHVEEMSYEEICNILKIGISAAKVRVHRACRALRELLSDYNDNGQAI